MLELTKARLRVLENILRSPGIEISRLISVSRISARYFYRFFEELKKARAVKIMRAGNVVQIFPALEEESGLLLFSIVELRKREIFLEKYGLRTQAEIAKRNLRKGEILLVFGSFARFSAGKGSDIDLAVISEKIEDERVERIQEAFIPGFEPSVRVFRPDDFMKAENPLVKSIIKDHVCLYGITSFLKLVGRSSFR